MAARELTPELLERLGSETGLAWSSDRGSCDEVAEDFGHLVHGSPRALARPRTAEEVGALLAFATAHGFRVTPRAGGNSQSGQSLSLDGLALDLSSFDRVDPPDLASMTIRCEASARWRDVAVRCLDAGALPSVMPLNLDLTVGGVLSAGGIGATSHMHGPSVANVVEIGAVTGDGTRLRASPTAEPALFDAVLGGLGRCAVMTCAELKLRRALPLVRTFYLVYDSPAPWLSAQRRLAADARCTYLEGFCSATVLGTRTTPQGRRPLAVWSFVLHAGVEHQPGEAPSAEQILHHEELHGYKLVHTDDDETRTFMARYDGRFDMMRRTGAWREAHPWIECLLPLDALPELLPRVLTLLPLFLGDGHRLTLVADRGPRFFMFPESRPVAAFAILPVGVPEGLRDDARKVLTTVHELLVAAGGKRYPSGWLGMVDDAGWRAHYGHRYDDWVAAKRRYDPGGVLASALFPSVQSVG